MADTSIELSDMAFWGLPLAGRAAVFARLRAEERRRFYPEPVVPFGDKGPGFYALVRHADVVEVSRHPEVFCSRMGATNIDGEQLTSAELASFFILLVVAGNETTRTALSHALMLFTEFPEQRELLLADFEKPDRGGGRGDRALRLTGPVHAADPDPGLSPANSSADH